MRVARVEEGAAAKEPDFGTRQSWGPSPSLHLSLAVSLDRTPHVSLRMPVWEMGITPPMMAQHSRMPN